MQQPLQITYRGLGPSPALETRIRAKVEELERRFGRITSCRVAVEAPHHHHHKGNLFAVHVALHLPNKELIASRERALRKAHDDVYVALRDAFAAVERRLEEHARRRRGNIKHHEVPSHGRIKELHPYDGYGFVRTVAGREIYFHENSLVGASLADLAVGDDVRFVIAEGEGDKGPQASVVSRVGKHHVVGRADLLGAVPARL